MNKPTIGIVSKLESWKKSNLVMKAIIILSFVPVLAITPFLSIYWKLRWFWSELDEELKKYF